MTKRPKQQIGGTYQAECCLANIDDDIDNKDEDYNKDDDNDNSDGEYDEDDLKSKVGMQGMMHPRRQQMIPGFSKPWDKQVSEQSGNCTENKNPNVKQQP